MGGKVPKVVAPQNNTCIECRAMDNFGRETSIYDIK
jgi:hypothetical protein